jgi:integrase
LLSRKARQRQQKLRLKPDEETRLFIALDNNEKHWLKSVVIVARETGLRLSNVCHLTWKQTDLFKRCIEIEKTKNGKPVWIPMSESAYAELTQLSRVRDLKSDRVFMVDGKPINRNWVSHVFKKTCLRAGVENFRFHDLRHDFCSRLIQAGQPLHVVAELAGHEDLSTTQRYAHLSPEMKRKAISSLDVIAVASR